MTTDSRARAAALARSRALAAIHQPTPHANDRDRATWQAVCRSDACDPCRPAVHDGGRWTMIHIAPVCGRPGDVVDHISLWDPATAGLVADLVECPCEEHADALARALAVKESDHG